MNNRGIIYILIVVLMSGFGCTNLDEDIYGRLTPETFFKNENEILSSLADVYSGIGFQLDSGNPYRLFECGTDEFVIPSRSDGRWFDGGVYQELLEHNWTPTNNRFSASWTQIFTIIGKANAFIANIQRSGLENIDGYVAEARVIRAYAYYSALDLWGNVPIFTDERVEPNNLPTNNTQQEVFEFIIKELKESISDLPSINNVDRGGYYGRITKEAGFSVLADVYLNGKVYTGQEFWKEASDYADSVINSKAYELTSSYYDNFVAHNENSKEIILARPIDPSNNVSGNGFDIKVLHDSHRFTYDLPFTPQNGFTTTEIAFNRYENEDERRDMILNGPQYDANGNPLPTIDGSSNLVLIPLQNYKNAAENEGYRVLKYGIDPNWVGSNGTNDYPIYRFAEILLIKAEALFRESNGNSVEALNLINEVRERSNAGELLSLTPSDILDERGRELIYEGKRRRDMIRFDTYLSFTWKFKTEIDPDYKKLYPIPKVELDANPNLKQNRGYN